MTVDELISSLTEEIKSENFILQVVFDRHISQIEYQKAQGVTYSRMMALLNEELENKFKKANFNTLVFRARQKADLPEQRLSGLEPVTTETIKKEVIKDGKTPTITTQQLNTKKKSSNDLKQSLKIWRTQTGIEIPERQALRLEEHGIDAEALAKHNFTKTNQINKHLTDLDIKLNHKEQK